MAEGRPVAVRGLGVVGPSGEGADAYWRALCDGDGGASPIASFSTEGLRSHAGACVRGFEAKRWVAPAKVRRLDVASRYAIAAARMALAEGGTSCPIPDADRAGCILGSTSAGATAVREFLDPVLRVGPQGALPMIFPSTVGNAPSSSVAIELGLKGPNVTQCQHEASGLLAIAMAAGYVAEGRADLMLAGGADEIPESFFRAFDALGVLARDDGATERSRPFAEGSRGFVMGEGAYLLRLVPASEAPALAVVAGHAVASDLVPPETWPRDPGTVAQAVEAALEDAGASACDVDLVVASANGVPALEDVEARGLLRAFHGKLPPVTGVKRLTGEMGGSGAASAVAAVLALQHQRLFGALGGDAPRASLPFSPWAKAMEAGVHLVVVTALAAGGTVAALVLTRA